MHIASISSIFYNIQYLAQQQSQHKMQWSTFRKISFRYFPRTYPANWPPAQHGYIIKLMKAREAWQEIQSELLEHYTACEPKLCLQWGKDKKQTCWAKKTKSTGSIIMWRDKQLWQGSGSMMPREWLSSRRKIAEMPKMHNWHPES